jgi:hypothetical protein
MPEGDWHGKVCEVCRALAVIRSNDEHNGQLTERFLCMEHYAEHMKELANEADRARKR